MNTQTRFVAPPDDEQFDYSTLLYAAASALIPYLGAVLLVMLGGQP